MASGDDDNLPKENCFVNGKIMGFGDASKLGDFK